MNTGDTFTSKNGKETLVITQVNPVSGRVKYKLDWQDRECSHWSGQAWVLKNYPNKVG